ncbi:MAG TPA: hypothetical protein VHX66_06430 [Solirubrobacteraceae bacterium]|jgi:hypothetical protein|nr:hypothetical protein [Solirubrobacteraceae bacterium]
MNSRYRHLLTTAGVIAGFAASASAADAATASSALPAATAACAAPSFFQGFSAFHDNDWYTLTPGETTDNFDGGGWTLSGGASIMTTTLADGQTGSVLNLPAGASATSPVMCVTSAYPSAKMIVRDINTPPGVSLGVKYLAGSPATSANVPGTPNGWSISPPLNLNPANTPGWQPVQFTITGNPKNSGSYQVYDFYVDPRCMGA